MTLVPQCEYKGDVPSCGSLKDDTVAEYTNDCYRECDGATKVGDGPCELGELDEKRSG